jgi:hypothetical protein
MAKKPSKPATAAPVELTLPKGTILALPGSMAHARCLQQSIDHYQRKFEAGDNLAWLQAVDACVIHGWPIPPWARLKFFLGMTEWLSYKAATLDEAWGLQRPSKQLRAGARRERLRSTILLRVAELHHLEGKPLTREMFATIGREVGMSGRSVEVLFYEPKNRGARRILRLL